MFWSMNDCYAEVDTRFDMSATYIASLFTEDFWSETVPVTGASALRVEKTFGHRAKIDAHGVWILFSPDDCDAERFDGVPEGWWADGCNMYPLDEDLRTEADGFGRLMRNNLDGIWGDEDALQHRLQSRLHSWLEYERNFPPLPSQPAYQF